MARSEIAQLYQSEADAWDRQRIEPERLIDAGDRVVVFQREYQRGRSSGLELVDETASLVDLRDGRVVRIQGYMDRAAALEAAGLSEEDATSGCRGRCPLSGGPFVVGCKPLSLGGNHEVRAVDLRLAGIP